MKIIIILIIISNNDHYYHGLETFVHDLSVIAACLHTESNGFLKSIVCSDRFYLDDFKRVYDGYLEDFMMYYVYICGV